MHACVLLPLQVLVPTHARNSERFTLAVEGGYRYIEIFTQMAQAIKATQIPEGDPWAGFWGPSLRAFDLFSTPESSGTGFFVGGLAWGIAEGILSPGEYLDVRPPQKIIRNTLNTMHALVTIAIAHAVWKCGSCVPMC